MSWLLFPALVAATFIAVWFLTILAAPREPWDLEETPERFRALQRAYERALRTLKDLEFDHQAGTLSEGEHASLKAEYKQRAVAARRALERLRLAAIRRIVAGKSVGPTGKERDEIEALVARARTEE